MPGLQAPTPAAAWPVNTSRALSMPAAAAAAAAGVRYTPLVQLVNSSILAGRASSSAAAAARPVDKVSMQANVEQLMEVLESLGGDALPLPPSPAPVKAQPEAQLPRREQGVVSEAAAAAEALAEPDQDAYLQQGSAAGADQQEQEEVVAAPVGSPPSQTIAAAVSEAVPGPAVAAAAASHAGQGSPQELWSLAVPDIVRQADSDHNGAISPPELSRFLFSYGLRVGDDLARELIIRHGGFATSGDVGSMQAFLQECWDAMLAALPEGSVAEEGRELVLSKQQCAQALPEFAGNRKVQQVLAGVSEEEEISYSLLVGLVLKALQL
jgi:hypothetical protein